MPLHIIISINIIEGGKNVKNRPKKLLLISALEGTIEIEIVKPIYIFNYEVTKKLWGISNI